MPNFQKPLGFPFATLWFRLKSEISQSLHRPCPWPCIVYKHLCLPLQYCKLPAPNSDYPQLLKRIERYFIVLHSFILYTLYFTVQPPVVPGAHLGALLYPAGVTIRQR